MARDGGLALYEQLDMLAERLGDDDLLAATLTDLLGLVWERVGPRHTRTMGYARNPDAQVEGDRTARRWLVDHGYMSRNQLV